MVVIDDEVNTCTFLRTVFEAEGHICHTFVRPEEGEQYLATGPADLVMVDVYLGSTKWYRPVAAIKGSAAEHLSGHHDGECQRGDGGAGTLGRCGRLREQTAHR